MKMESEPDPDAMEKIMRLETELALLRHAQQLGHHGASGKEPSGPSEEI